MTGLENRASEDGIIDEALSTPNEVRNHENYFHLINDSIATTLKSSSVNYLLLFIPLGILSSKLNWSPSLIFTTNFLAIIPLASILAFATEQLGDTLNNNSIAGLFNATFGNAVEVIVSIIALKQNQVTVVQASMLGSILSNLLLVLGSCFIVGGLKFKQQSFNQTAAQTMGSLLAVSVMTLLLPAAFYLSVPKDTKNLDLKILDLSRGTSVILLVVYGFYMVFQLKTHYFLFADDESDIDEGQNALQLDNDEVPAPFYGSTSNDVESQLSNNSRRSSIISRPKSVHNLQHNDYQLSTFGSILILLLSTVFVSICADYLVSTIDEIVESSGLSKTFIGLIIIPIVGNAAEHVTAIYVAYKNKMDLAIGVAIGSSLQIAIFVTPFLVLVGWFMDVPMSLYFSCFETAVIFVSVFITNSLILDGSSNWLEGVLLISTYLIIAIAFFLFPDTLGE